MKVAQLPEKIYDLISDKDKLTIGNISSLSEEGVGIILQEGFEDDRYFGKKSLPRPMVRIPIRTKTYKSGIERAQAIKDDLDNFTDADILQCISSGSPTYIGKNQQKMHEFAITFKIILRE